MGRASPADRSRVPSSHRRIRLRRPDRCVACHAALRAGDAALWDAGRREVRCVGCEPAPSVPPPPIARESAPGASARREYERRRAKREERVRARWGRLADVALILGSEPADEKAWAKGAAGEVELARKLERWTADAGVVLLHDRRVPGSRANIDHIAVGPAGVFVIDAKRYTGRIAVERPGGLLGPRTEHLIVGGHDRSKLLDGMHRQLDFVGNVLVPHPDVTVSGVLCFVDGDWPLFGTLQARGIPVLPPHKAAKLCAEPGPLDVSTVRVVATRLAEALVAA